MRISFARIYGMDNLLTGLNDEQRKAVLKTDGPLLIQAGAGSGKTKTLTHRIAHIIEQQLAFPEQILAVTFTNKAAKEMRSRIWELMNGQQSLLQSEPPRSFLPYMGTFHGVCVRFLRQDGEHIGVPKTFVIYDESDRLAAVKQVSKALMVDEKAFPPRSIANMISSAKNDAMTPREFASKANSPGAKIAADVYPGYQKALKDAGALDFDDLITKTLRLLSTVDEVREKWRQHFKYIMIDEYQDTNGAQYQLINKLVNEDRNIAVVGDDWQCLPGDTKIETPSGKKKIKEISKGDIVMSAAGYGKTCESVVSKVRNSNLNGNLVTVKLKSGSSLNMTANHITFVRSNEIKDKFFVYLMESKQKGFRIGTAKSTRTDGKRLDSGLRVRANQERADKMWILGIYNSKEDAETNEAIFAYKYGIPMLVFHAYPNRKMNLSQSNIDSVYSAIDTRDRAHKLMNELDISPEYPHFIPGGVVKNEQKRVVINSVLFGSKREFSLSAPWSNSRLSVNTSDVRDLKPYADKGYNVRSAKNGTHRVEIQSKDYGDIEKLVDSFSSNENYVIARYSYLTSKKFIQVPAAQVHTGMTMAVLKGDKVIEDIVESVSIEPSQQEVFDLDIKSVHNYIAEGVVVHNSVYGWRGADFRNILKFEKDFAGTTVIKLEQNYRSTKPILDGAYAVISKNKQRSDKELWTAKTEGKPIQVISVSTERAEAETLVRRIKNNVDGGMRRLNDYAVLYRTNAQSRAIEEAFLHYNVPYRIVGGQRFYDRKEIKDIMSYLKFIYQPADIVSFERVVNVPARGIGKASLLRFHEWRLANDASLIDALQQADKIPKLPPKAVKGLKDLADIVVSTQTVMDDSAVVGIIDALIRRIDYIDYLGDGTPAGEARQENVKELLGVAKEYSELGLSGFLEEVSLVSDLDTADFGSNVVTLMTMHAAKGLEFPVVFMAGMEETIFPHSRSLYDQSEMEEERRLCYVGMTRAKEELYMLHAATRMLYGGIQHNPPARFLSEISGESVQETSTGFGSNTGYSSSFSAQAAASKKPEMTGWAANIDSSPKSDEPRYVPDYEVGEQVEHALFGRGRIVDMEGDNIAISFGSKGVKKLNASFAPIKKV
ncbi:MAG: DNA helicase-2/ATP-dependent DNA helicase PcrA [Candidatus Saccharimonadales bacterium]|jgi:DNA helicase-2/ATP-dependent DNA helicase PcrA